MDLNLLLSVENPQNKAGPTGPHIEKLSISNSDRSNLCVWSVKTHRVSWRTQSYCTHNKDFLSVLLHIDLNVLQSKTPPPQNTHTPSPSDAFTPGQKDRQDGETEALCRTPTPQHDRY